MARAQAIGADRVELYTEPYAQASGSAHQAAVLGTFAATAAAAQRLGLGVNAGHDLNRANLGAFLAAVPASRARSARLIATRSRSACETYATIARIEWRRHDDLASAPTLRHPPLRPSGARGDACEASWSP